MNSELHIDFSRTALEEGPAREFHQEQSLRPVSFAEYPGQARVCENLKVYIQAARMKGRMLDHALLHGPPGLGKTTLAGIIARELGAEFKVTSGPVLDSSANLMGVLAGLESGQVLFIDEIHRIPAHVEEVLYKALEDQRLDILVGQGPSARTVEMQLPMFTLIGATTRAGALSRPLRDRFGIVEHLEYYQADELQKILNQSAEKLNVVLENDASYELARRSRGTPRIANHLLRRVIDHATVEGVFPITLQVVDRALIRRGIDGEGLDRMDRELLLTIAERYQNRPVGLEAIAAALNEEKSTLENVYEPYLIFQGFLSRTANGRMLTPRALEHLKKYPRADLWTP